MEAAAARDMVKKKIPEVKDRRGGSIGRLIKREIVVSCPTAGAVVGRCGLTRIVRCGQMYTRIWRSYVHTGEGQTS